MISLLVSCLLGATTFVKQDIDCVSIGFPNQLTGEPVCNFQRTDLDGDGAQDLVFEHFAIFQRNQGFRATDKAEYPTPSGDGYAIQVWANRIYRLDQHTLQELAWTVEPGGAGSWKQSDWPTPEFACADVSACGGSTPPEEQDSSSSASEPESEKPARCFFERFLHDFDGDGIPEVVRAKPDGLHIWRKSDADGVAVYVSAGVLPVYPPPYLIRNHTAIWPQAARGVIAPGRDMNCDIVLDGPRIAVYRLFQQADQMRRYQITPYQTVSTSSGFALDTANPAGMETEPLPRFVEPCRLNADSIVDYAGNSISWSGDGANLSLISTTYATLDGGRTHVRAISSAYKPSCLFIDFDHDGDMDLVSESNNLGEGGIRETLARLISENTVTHIVEIRFQQDGAFSARPDVRGEFEIQLPDPPMFYDALFQRYLNSRLVYFGGDFNGDGIRDALVQTDNTHLSVFAGGMQGYASKPEATLDIEPGKSFGVADVDGDGRSDIGVMEDSAPFFEPSKTSLYLSRENTPGGPEDAP